MDTNNPMGNKRVPETSAETLDSCTRKIKKMNVIKSSMAGTASDGVGFPRSNSKDRNLSDKMTNIAKLRQQFIQEIKDVELSLKESIKNLKHKITEANKKNDYMDEKLKEANQILCSQAQSIYEKEQEYESLREKVKEFYEYQKVSIENMEDISDTLNVNENLSNKLKDQFQTILMAQESKIHSLEKQCENVTPDVELSKELEKLESETAEFQKGIKENENKAKQLKSELEMMKLQEEKDLQKLKELDKEISERESRIQKIKLEKDKEKKDLLNEIEKLDKEIKSLDELSNNLDSLQIPEAKKKLEQSRNNENEIQKKTKEMNNEIDLLLKEIQQLDEMQYNEAQQNTIHMEKLEETLKILQDEFESEKKKQNQIISIIDKKIADLADKAKNFNAIKAKVEKYEVEIKKEEELILKITEESETKKSEMNDELELVKSKISESKKKKSNADSNLGKAEKRIKVLEKEISEVNEKLKARALKQSSKYQVSNKSIGHYGLPSLFAEETGVTAKPSNKKASFNTPMMGNDDLEIDELPIEEQFSRLTQTPTSSTSEKGKKFFKHSTTSQKPRKESTPRGRGRAKKF